jgi:hypothetical protein
LQSLPSAFRKGLLRFHGELHSLADASAFQLLCHPASGIQWVVHVKPPFAGPERVLKYHKLQHCRTLIALCQPRIFRSEFRADVYIPTPMPARFVNKGG